MSELPDIQARITAAAAKAGRTADDVRLVAVSKTKPADAVSALIAEGQLTFGENRVQEAQEKFPDLKAAHPALNLHLIGPLQTNKAKDAVALFDVIQSVDRPKLADHLARAQEAAERALTYMIQVNTGAEPQKAGVCVEDLPELYRHCRDAGLNVTGLMCIPPADRVSSPHFAFMGKLADELGLPHRSMGMSSDFEAAAELGATHVRVGSALFGARNYG